MVIHHQPGRLRHNSDQPTAITDVLVATSGPSYPTGEIPLGAPTCSARRLTRLGGDRHDDLDHAAAQAIRQLLTDPAADGLPWPPATRARTWSTPAVGYWLSGPTNQPGLDTHTPASRPGAPTAVPPPIPLPDRGPKPARARAA